MIGCSPFVVPAATSAGAPDALATFPSQRLPWKRAGATNDFAAYQQSIRQLMAAPAEAVRAHPAAADFPGPVASEAPRLTRTISVDTAIPRWHSTGLYAAPGELITVTISSNAVAGKLAVRIGCHRDQLWSEAINAWTRVPEITRRFALAGGITKAANAFGGPVFIEVPDHCGLGVLAVTIENAVAAPLFELGQTGLAQWKNEIRLRPAPWAELAGHNLIISLPSKNIRDLENPEEVLQYWDRIVAAEDDLAGLTNRRSPERFVLDRQISAGYMHSGYPIMAHLDQAGRVAEMTALSQGNWGFYHELGHNHQRPDWTFAGAGEVTCNLFSMYCFAKVCGLSRHGHGGISAAKRQANMLAYFTKGGSFTEWKSDPFLALICYDQLIEAFGWDSFQKVFAEYRDLPKLARPKSDDEKRDQWLVRFSRATGRNLGPFFEAWRIPTSAAARESLKDLPAWMPTDFPPTK